MLQLTTVLRSLPLRGFFIGAAVPYLVWMITRIESISPSATSLLNTLCFPGLILGAAYCALVYDHPRMIGDHLWILLILTALFYGFIGWCVGLLFAARRREKVLSNEPMKGDASQFPKMF